MISLLIKSTLKRIVYHVWRTAYNGWPEKRGRPILTGTDQEIRQQVTAVLEEAPDRFILGAECALLGEVDWKKVRNRCRRGSCYYQLVNILPVFELL